MAPAYPKSLPGLFDIVTPANLLAPLVLDSPHSGTLYPDDFGANQPPSRYRRAEDMYVDDLFSAAPGLGLPLLACRFARIYCDVNRAADDLAAETIDGGETLDLNPSTKARLGKGTIWMATPPDGAPLYGRKLKAAEIRHRIENYWKPYHEALKALIDGVHEDAGVVYHLNLHSMQARANPMHEDAPGSMRPDIVLSDREGQTCRAEFIATVREMLASLGFDVRINDPYKGAEIVRVSGAPEAGRHSLQIEINRRLYMDEASFEKSSLYPDTKAKLTLFVKRLGEWVRTAR